MADTILKPIYLVPELGEYALIPDGAIINIGGVQGPTFTVGGKGLLFTDGTSSDGSHSATGNNLRPDLQTVYNNSTGEGFIDFTSGKDLVLQAVNKKQFRFDADTGDVTISGNLIVQGTTTTVIHASIDTDRVAIHQTAGNYVPFIMEPLGGVTPSVNVIDIKVAHGGASVFTIGPTGSTYIKDLVVGQINGVDLALLAQQVHDHLFGTGIKHKAVEVSVDQTHLGSVAGTNLQEVVDNLSMAVTALQQHQVGNILGFEHVQTSVSKTWIIPHNQNTKRVQITIWDVNDDQLWADVVHIMDANTVLVKFGTPITGRAILMLF